MALGDYKLPTNIISNEYVTLEKKKISTSRNWAVWIPELLKSYHPDSIRYFLIANAPETRDADFSWREFVYSHNSELLGAFANFVNRTFKFIEKSFNSKVEEITVDKALRERVQCLYDGVGTLIEKGQIKQALETIFDFIREGNRYFDEREPWKFVKVDIAHTNETLANCTYIIQNLGQLLKPFIPFGTSKLEKMIGISLNSWKEIDKIPKTIMNVKPLYERIDVKNIELELEKLKARNTK